MCAPHPHTISASFKCGGRLVAGPAPPLRALGKEGPHRSMPGIAGRASERRAGRGGLYPRSPHPDPLLYPDPPSLLQVPHLFQLPAPPLRPPPPPPQAPLGSRSTLSGSLSRFQRGCSPGLAPGSLLSALHLAPEAATATGAVRRTPTPRPGYFPPPRSRESCAPASGRSREVHHHGSGCSRSSQYWRRSPGGVRCGAGICGRWWRKLGNWAETVGTGEKSKGYACYLRTGAAKWAQWRLGLLGQSQEAGGMSEHLLLWTLLLQLSFSFLNQG